MEFSLSWADLTNQKLWKRIHFSQSEALKPDPLCLLLLLWWSLIPDAEQGWPIRCSETVSTLANQKLWIRIHFEGCHPLLQQTSHHFKFFCLVLFSKASSEWGVGTWLRRRRWRCCSCCWCTWRPRRPWWPRRQRWRGGAGWRCRPPPRSTRTTRNPVRMIWALSFWSFMYDLMLESPSFYKRG